MKTKLLTSILFFVNFSLLYAQFCGTVQTVYQPNLQRSTSSNAEFLNSENELCINVFYHIVRSDSGNGGYSPNDLINITDNLNNAFSPHNIHFVQLGFEYIDDSTYIEVHDFGSNTTEFGELVQINNYPNAINVYLITNALAVWIARANGIMSNAIVIENQHAESHVLSHEVGHCLNLWHTFHGSTAEPPSALDPNACPENIDGSNCDTCGDYVCDTPADANTENIGGYSPDMTNIMSYYQPFDHFTTGQNNRIREAFVSSSFLQQLLSNNCSGPELIGTGTICSTFSQTYNLENSGNNVSWNVSSNLNIISSDNSSITVQAVNPIANGAGFIEAILPFQTIRKDIWIGKPRLLSAMLDNGQYLAHGSTPNRVCKLEQIKTNISIGGASNASWSIISSSHTTSWSQLGNNLTFYLWAVNHTATFRITLNNSCGIFTRDYTFNIKDCSGGGNDPCDPSMAISQNPVDNEIEVINIPAPCDPVLSK